MRLVRLSLLLLLAVTFVGTALAAPGTHPAKDWNYVSNPRPNAIIPEQEPNDVCPGQSMNIGDEINPASLIPGDTDYYQFYGTAGQVVTIQTGPVNSGDCTDTMIYLYYGCNTSYLIMNDDGSVAPCYVYSLISQYTLPYTGYYQIQVVGYANAQTGPYVLDVTAPVVNPPDPNDTCNPDYLIADGTQGVLNGDMTYDNNNYDPGSGGCSTGFAEQGVDVAYMMNLTAGDVVDMTYNTPGFDASFYIITDCSNPAGSCVVGADASYDTEVIDWTVPTTGTYWLILDHYGLNSGKGPWNLSYTIVSPTPTGACCDPVTGDCTVTTQAGCGGQYLGDGISCTPNPCTQPVPTKESTWGQIKAQYR
jgi:hypothetical protein